MIAPAGQKASCGWESMLDCASPSIGAPFRLRHVLRSESQERERRGVEDGRGDHDGGLHDDRGDRVRQHVPEHDRASLRHRATSRARTWSDSRWASIWPRSNRANTGICGMPTAMITLVRFGLVNSTPIEIASSRLGMESMTSTIRIRTVSTQPPKAPASNPRIESADQTDEGGDDADQQRLPWPRRPSGRRSPGPGCRRRAGNPVATARWRCGHVEVCPISTWAPGSCGAIHGPMIASTTNSPTITAPTQNSGDTRSRDQASLSSDVPSSPEETSASIRCLRARE